MSPENDKDIIHVVRYDDFSATSHTAVESSMFDIFLRLRIPCTVAVIPFICDPKKLLQAGEVFLLPLPRGKARMLEPLLEAGLAEIALHGFAHLALAPMRGYQEFSDAMPIETQRSLLRRGRRHLEEAFGVRVRLFVPPWNRLSESTAEVLREEGLQVSGDLQPDARAGAECGQMPCATLIEDTGKAFAAAHHIGGQSNVIGTMIHDYDFVESGYGVGSMTMGVFDRIAGEWARMPNVRRMLISDALAGHQDARAERNRANRQFRGNLQHSRLGRLVLSRAALVYWDTRRAERLATLASLLP